MSDDITKTDEAIRTRLSSIFPNAEVREKVIKLVTSPTDRPETYGPDSNSPYYKKHYGEQMRSLADDQLTTLRDIVYDYKTFCKPWNVIGCSEQTLYIRVNQSIRFLCERLDNADGKYRSWKDIIRVRQVSSVGVVISIDPEIKAIMSGDTSSVPTPRMAEPLANKKAWEEKLDKWLESDDDSLLLIRNIILTDEEQEKIRNQLMGDRRIEFIVSHNEIRALKINPDAQ